MAFAGPAAADVFRLKSGGKIEGEVIAETSKLYQVRGAIGVVEIDKADILERIPGKPSWVLYEEKRKTCPDTAAAHYKLGVWCREQGMTGKARCQFEHAIRLDADHAPSRKALGHVRVNGKWVDQSKRSASSQPTNEEDRQQREQADQDKLVRKIVTEWFLKVRAIHRARFEGKNKGSESEAFRKGREQILAIRDPLALPALTGVLSSGNAAVRQVLIEALAQFKDDEATMNLVVISLMDPSKENRRLAAEALRPRNDERVVCRLRDALNSSEEGTLRHAAAALGVLKAEPAIEDLVAVLSTTAVASVEYTRPVFYELLLRDFGGRRRVISLGDDVYYRPEYIGVLARGTAIGTATFIEWDTVSVHRTEVQEALISITGQNFGFDAEAWMDWWNGQKARK